jgi:ABC-type uncharacterized transport system ATPase subunit
VENSVLKAYRRPPIGRGPFVDWGEARRMTEGIMRTLEVRAVSADTRVRLLSGGNLQRLLLAREMSERPRVVVAVHPTRGLDVGATGAVRLALRAQQQSGVAILLISEDLDELLALADPIGVLYEGALVGVLPRDRCTVEDLGLLMTGAQVQEGSV